MSAKKIIFVTGTDTGVGKTLLAALLLNHLRNNFIHALAMKPFCSGGTDDVDLLQSLQPGELTYEEANPFYFAKPIAPLVAARRKQIKLDAVLASIQAVHKKCDTLIIEGSGGLMVPLGTGYTVADLIAALDCKVIIAARNRLGTINHTLLTVSALKVVGKSLENIAVALMDTENPDLSAQTNHQTLTHLLKPIGVFSVPFLGLEASTQGVVQESAPKMKKVLAKLG